MIFHGFIIGYHHVPYLIGRGLLYGIGHPRERTMPGLGSRVVLMFHLGNGQSIWWVVSIHFFLRDDWLK